MRGEILPIVPDWPLYYCDSCAPLLKLVKSDNLGIFFYKNDAFNLLGIDVYPYQEFV